MYRYNTNSCCIETDREETGLWKKTLQVDEVVLHLIHFGDYSCKDLVNSELRIWYGGHGYEDNRNYITDPKLKDVILTDEQVNAIPWKDLVLAILNGAELPDFIYDTERDKPINLRLGIIEQLFSPTNFNWDDNTLLVAFQGQEYYWNNFKNEALKLLKEQPNLEPSSEIYRTKYRTLLNDLRENTIDNYL